MSGAEWIAKRREKAERFCTGFGDTEGVGGVVAIVAEDLPRALDALEAALELAKRHRDFVTKRGRDDCICTICDMCRAIESALRGES